MIKKTSKGCQLGFIGFEALKLFYSESAVFYMHYFSSALPQEKAQTGKGDKYLEMFPFKMNFQWSPRNEQTAAVDVPCFRPMSSMAHSDVEGWICMVPVFVQQTCNDK